MTEIRAATLADVDAIAALHAASWRSAYRGILNESTLGPSLDADRCMHWRAELAAMTPDDVVLIADGLGFVAVWGEAMRRIAGQGETAAYLWVFDRNTRAIDFYRRLGGEIAGGGFDEIDGRQVAHNRICWRDTARLAAQCAR